MKCLLERQLSASQTVAALLACVLVINVIATLKFKKERDKAEHDCMLLQSYYPEMDPAFSV